MPGAPPGRLRPGRRGNRALLRAQFLLPKAPSIWAAASESGRPGIVLIFPATGKHGARGRLPHPIIYLFCRPFLSYLVLWPLFTTPHPSEKADILIISCRVCIVPFSQATILYGQLLFVIHLLLNCHLRFKVFVYIS